MIEDIHSADFRDHLPPLDTLQRVAILGGSFNPPHMGHAFLAQLILSVTEIDQLWVMPVADHPFHKANVAFEHRLEMCRLNFAPLGGKVAILDLEEYLPKPSYTVQTLQILGEFAPGVAFTFVFGSDIIGDLPKWRSPEMLSQYANILVYPRRGYPIDTIPDYLNATTITHEVIPELSSTFLRDHFGALTEDDGRISPNVLNYARNHKLY